MEPHHRYGSGRGAKPTLYLSRATVIGSASLKPEAIQVAAAFLVRFSPHVLWHANVQHAS